MKKLHKLCLWLIVFFGLASRSIYIWYVKLFSDGVKLFPFPESIVVQNTPAYNVYKACTENLRKSSDKTMSAKNSLPQKVRGCREQGLDSAKNARSKRSTPCSNVPSWLYKATSGLDVSILDFLGPVGSNGIENSLFRYTCDFGRTLVVGTVIIKHHVLQAWGFSYLS